MSFAILIKLTATFLKPRSLHERIATALRLKMIFRLAQIQSGFLRNSRNRATRKIRVSIDSRPNRRSTKRQFAQIFLRRTQPRQPVLNLARVTAKFLPKPNRRCVLQMRPANFKNVVEILRLFVEAC